jgi:hypothetical protein
MTVKEFAAYLQSLPQDQQDLPLCDFDDDCIFLIEVTGITVEERDTPEDFPKTRLVAAISAQGDEW